MGKKKKFIDKKNSATFHLLARDSSDANATVDRIFVRVDNNPYFSNGIGNDGAENLHGVVNFNSDPNYIFDDAPGDINSDEEDNKRSFIEKFQVSAPLSDHTRREILELGLPDDGYNYLLHMREIKNTGGGSSYYHNSKAKLDMVPLDVKAYDASRLRISSEFENDLNVKSIYSVAEKTIGVRIQKAVDPDVTALLDETDSRFGSDVDELEEDFVVQANIPEEREEVHVVGESVVDERSEGDLRTKEEFGDHMQVQEVEVNVGDELIREADEFGGEKPRVPRLLDEQFDLLTRREYDSDNETDGDAGFLDVEEEPLSTKLNQAFKVFRIDEQDLSDKYKVPADFLHDNEASIKDEPDDSPADVIRLCVEYAEMYNHEIEDEVVVEESSDESEVWDCETIVSTYSNLDNHPGKIQAPVGPKRRLIASLAGGPTSNNNVIPLRGREKLPVEYLPHGRRTGAEKVKKVATLGDEQQRRRPHGEESKEARKERKAAVKEERREARRAKKSLKGLYKCEAQLAQKVAATTGPCSVHLM